MELPKSENWPIEKLIEYARNPRKNDHAVDDMAANIKEFGFRVPIVAKSDGLVVDGHLRLKGAKKLGMKIVPVMLADDLSDAQIKAFRLAVNKMAEKAEWDDDLLKIELQEIKDLGFDDMEVMGFEDLEGILGAEIEESGLPWLDSGEKDLVKMTFVLSLSQFEEIKDIIPSAYGFFEDDINDNKNGNAIYWIAKQWEELKK